MRRPHAGAECMWGGKRAAIRHSPLQPLLHKAPVSPSPWIFSQERPGPFYVYWFSLERFPEEVAPLEGSCGSGEGLAMSWSPTHSVPGH